MPPLIRRGMDSNGSRHALARARPDRGGARACARAFAAAPQARRRDAREQARPRPRHRLARPHRTGAAHRAHVQSAAAGHRSRRDGDGRRPAEGGRACRARRRRRPTHPTSRVASRNAADRTAGRRQDADRDARLARAGASGSHPRHGAAGRERGARHHELSRPADRRERGRARADQPRHRAGRPRRHDAADKHGFLRVVLRHPLCRRGAGADLSARPHGAARRTHAPPDRDPAQRRRAHADHRAGGPQARRAAALTGRDAEMRRDRCDASAERSAAAAAAAQRPRSARADAIHLGQHRRPEGRDADALGPSGKRARHGPRDGGLVEGRVRELAAALSRHGTDRRVARLLLFRRAALRDVADRVPGAPGHLAVDHAQIPRDVFRRAEFRIRAVREPHSGR